MLSAYFSNGIAQDPLLWQQHDPWLVALSFALSIGAALLALQVAALAQSAPTRWLRQAALLTGALAFGGGIWAMHFVGMLAYTVCAQSGFDGWATAFSMLPSIVASWVALRLLAQQRPNVGALWMGGALMGLGVGAMHYLGMAASYTAPGMRFDWLGYLASIGVAVVLAVLGLWVRFRLQHALIRNTWLRSLLAALVLGSAVAGMHYTGMGALRYGGPQAPGGSEAVGMANSHLVAIIVLVVVVLGLLVLAVNAGLRYHQMYLQIQRAESRSRAVLETAAGGIIIVDGDGIVQSFNRSASQILGWTAQEVVGNNVRRLLPDPPDWVVLNARADAEDPSRLGRLGDGREVEALSKRGDLVPIRLAMGRVQLPGKPLFVGFFSDITTRRAMEASLRRSEDQLRSLMSNIPGVTYRSQADDVWSMLFMHGPVESMTGWRSEDFVQGRVHLGDIIHPQDMPAVRIAFDSALKEHRSYSIEYRVIHRDGSVRWVSDTGQGLAEETAHVRWVDGVILDITTAKSAQAEFQGLVAAVDRAIAVVEFDLAGNILSANDNLLAMMGYSIEEIRGHHHDLFYDETRAGDLDFAQTWQHISRGEAISGEVVRYGKDGRAVWMHASYNPIFDAEGKPFKVVSFATDLTQRRAMEEALRAAKERAESAAAARSTFLANMSHEIRTPMNAIMGFTDALLHTTLDDTQRRHLTTVQHASRTMLRLLNDILDTAKLDKGAVTLEIADFSLRELCRQTLDSLGISAAKKQVRLVLDYPQSVPEYLRGDAHRLQQVLVNLVGNAIKFTEHGQVRLRVRYDAEHLVFSVQDTGIGMTQAQIAHIFEPFAQADVSTARRFGGTGLGTTISRQLVELMGGSIQVQSAPGSGTEFLVRVPLPVGQAAPAEVKGQALGLPSLLVLAVDDVANNLELLKLTLERGAHEVILADGGEAAVQRCEHRRFDLVLMDLQMPGVDGIEATRRIRAHERAAGLRPVPIIALSASVLEEDRINARSAGMNGFADKPVDVVNLYREIDRVLKQPPAGVSDAMNMGWENAAQDSEPSGVEDADDARSASATALDAALGTRLWQNEPAWHQAIGRFVRENAGLVDALQADMLSSDWSRLQASAHRARGAAANLAMTALQQRLAQLEAAARQGDATLARQACAAVAEAWDLTLQQIAHAIPGSAHRPAGGPPGESAVHQRLSAESVQQALAVLEVVQASLVRGEMPESALAPWPSALPATARAPLQEALEQFDFEQALAQVEQLRGTMRAALSRMPSVD